MTFRKALINSPAENSRNSSRNFWSNGKCPSYTVSMHLSSSITQVSSVISNTKRVIAIVLPWSKRTVYNVQKSGVPVLEHGEQLVKVQFVLFLFLKLRFHVFHCFGLPIHRNKIKWNKTLCWIEQQQKKHLSSLNSSCDTKALRGIFSITRTSSAHTSLPQCLPPTECINGYQRI